MVSEHLHGLQATMVDSWFQNPYMTDSGMVIIVSSRMIQERGWHCLQIVLYNFVHGANKIQTLMWVLLQAQQEQQECVREATEPSLAKDLVAQTHKQAASTSPGYFTSCAGNTAELSATLPNASPASMPSEHRYIQMSVNTSAGTPLTAVKDVKENAQTQHGSRKRAKSSEPLEQVMQTDDNAHKRINCLTCETQSLVCCYTDTLSQA